jgi:LacI family gluconate utilization system Gnt-I transcriptional repressor
MSKKRSRPSLQDVADAVGVTKMTVSRFLRDPSLVSQELQTQLSKAVEKVGYIPNKAPGILSNSKSHAVGVLVPSLSNQVFSDVISGIESVLEPKGYQTMLAHTGYSQQSEEDRVATLLAYHVDGLILSESQHTDRVRKMIETTGIPVVEIMDSVSDPISQSVGFDNQAASSAMTQRMIDKGYSKLVYLAARMDLRTQQKLKGFEVTMAQNGLKPESIQTEDASSFSLGSELLKQALKKHPELDGIVCTNDDIAIGALFECQRQKINIPEQIAIAGFHGHNFAQEVVPKLATVNTPREKMGEIAAQQLLDRFENKPMETNVYELAVELVDGETI